MSSWVLLLLMKKNKYVVVEALAGCGKTAMLLTGLVKRINQKKAVLLLSVTKQTVTIAGVRTDDNLHVQTFDSLFFQTVKHGLANGDDMDKNTDAYTYETFRDVSETLCENDLKTFVGKAATQYKMDKIEFILVDEAQDTPPQEDEEAAREEEARREKVRLVEERKRKEEEEWRQEQVMEDDKARREAEEDEARRMEEAMREEEERRQEAIERRTRGGRKRRQERKR